MTQTSAKPACADSGGDGKLDPKFVNILWASVEQAEELAGMHAQVFEEGWNAQTFARLLTDPACTAFVAQIGPPLVTVGFVIGRFAADEAEILTLGVAPNAQKRGIGRLLVEAMGRAAKIAEMKRLYLEVAAGNDAAIKLYRALEYEDVGRRSGDYTSANAPPENALVMARDL